jgi:hypothetical protein
VAGKKPTKHMSVSLCTDIHRRPFYAADFGVTPPAAESEAKTVNSYMDKGIEKNLDATLTNGAGAWSDDEFVLSRAGWCSSQRSEPNISAGIRSINTKVGKENSMRVRLDLRQCVWVLALILGSGITGGMVRAVASPAPQDQPHDQAHDQDYSKNKTYQQGLREGQDDHKHNKDHSKKRHFKKDEDQKAYEAGYQQGHQGDQHDR